MREPQNHAKPTSVEIVAEFSSAFHFAHPICQSVSETTTYKYSKTDRCQLASEPTDIFPVVAWGGAALRLRSQAYAWCPGGFRLERLAGEI